MSMEKLQEDLIGNNFEHFKYTPITSSDVERSFLLYKNIISDNHRSFDIQNIKKVIVIQCNTFIDIKVIIYIFTKIK